MTNVKCSVENCYYYGEGNVCTADTIMVETEEFESNNFNEEFGEIGNNSKDQAKSKEQTICSTFKAK